VSHTHVSDIYPVHIAVSITARRYVNISHRLCEQNRYSDLEVPVVN
jgi:hypothetical protein